VTWVAVSIWVANNVDFGKRYRRNQRRLVQPLPVWSQILTNVQAKMNRCRRAIYVVAINAAVRNCREHGVAGRVPTEQHEECSVRVSSNTFLPGKTTDLFIDSHFRRRRMTV
jgi:hypothetical protein